MGPLVAIVSSALFRAAGLIERGTQPAKALRQVANELIEYEETADALPDRVVDLSVRHKPRVRAV